MKPTLFISDLHLSAARPAMVDAFERFCAGQAREAIELYVLGDLFDTWAGALSVSIARSRLHSYRTSEKMLQERAI